MEGRQTGGWKLVTGNRRPGWQPGQSGNPAGRPIGARQRIAEKLLKDLSAVWNDCGEEVLRRLAKDEPSKLASIAYGLLPKDIFIKVENADPLADLDDESLQALQSLLATIRKAGASGEGDLFQRIEGFLRSEGATVIEAKSEE